MLTFWLNKFSVVYYISSLVYFIVFTKGFVSYYMELSRKGSMDITLTSDTQSRRIKQCLVNMFGPSKTGTLGADRLEWKILGRAKSFNPISGTCRLCLLEKYFIMFNPTYATLNSRHEIFIPCKHKKKHLLSNAKTWSMSPRTSWSFLKSNLNVQHSILVQNT